MKQLKKNPRKQLEKFSTVFMQLGLVLSLFVTYIFIEHQSKIEQPTATVYDTDEPFDIDFDRPVIYQKVEVSKPKVEIPKPSKTNNLSEVNVVDDPDVIESVINAPIDNNPQVFDPEDIIEVIEEPVIEENVPFILIEDVPVYKGCENLNKEATKACFIEKITKHVQRHFNSRLSEDLGLRSGKHKIYTLFVINKKGEISDVKIKAPHPRLKKEAKRIVDKIPLFTPGKQRGKPVNVKYTLPITFYVE